MGSSTAMDGTGPIDVAGEGDRAATAAALAEAFMDDPVAIWATPKDRHRPGALRRFFGAVYDTHIDGEVTYVDSERRSAAIWALPDRWQGSARNELRTAAAFAHPRHWPRLPHIVGGVVTAEASHPRTEHFYLATLGVAPDRQGEGLGSRLLAPVLEICDSDGVPAYLESSKHSNIAFYARHGFRVTGELRLPGGGPVLYPMWREPR